LKTPKFTHKSIAALRKRKLAASIISKDGCASEDHSGLAEGYRRLGDGFDSSEIKSGRGHKTKRRKAPKTLAVAFEALQLQAGPLPDVTFQDSSSEIKVETNSTDDNNIPSETDNQEFTRHNGVSTSPGTSKDSRKVGFSDRVFDQLSSISAPRRIYSISSDGSDDEDNYDDSECDLEEESQNGNVGSRQDGSEADSEGEQHQAPPPNQKSVRSNNVDSAIVHMHPDPKSTGVTLDFRRALTPGMHPRRSSITKIRLMEVNDTIVDDPFVDQKETSDLPSDPYLIRGVQAPPVGHGTSRRPRSILRNHTPNIAEGTTSKEYTFVNTRRNSIITTEDSHYFNAATSMLRRGQDQARQSGGRIVTQNANDTAASAYFARQRREIHVLDSETVIPETSPEIRLRDYTAGQGLRMLQISLENRSSLSAALPAVPRDLKTLTRNVSREHGTLSQAAKRRPSLPFQSPTKVGR
jgi:hypothetical protein